MFTQNFISVSPGVDSKLVVFIDVKTPLLCIDFAKKLNIVHINTKGSPEHRDFKPKKSEAEATQNTKSNLIPFQKNKRCFLM